MKKREPSFDYRELIQTIQSRPAAHQSDSRPGPDDHYANYKIDEGLLNPHPKTIVVYDDIITTGASFKSMQRVVEKTYPEAAILGLFIARAVHPSF